jgi:hypothetical protein
LLKSAEGFAGLSQIGKMEWLNSLNTNIAKALGWLGAGGGAM